MDKVKIPVVELPFLESDLRGLYKHAISAQPGFFSMVRKWFGFVGDIRVEMKKNSEFETDIVFTSLAGLILYVLLFASTLTLIPFVIMAIISGSNKIKHTVAVSKFQADDPHAIKKVVDWLESTVLLPKKAVLTQIKERQDQINKGKEEINVLIDSFEKEGLVLDRMVKGNCQDYNLQELTFVKACEVEVKLSDQLIELDSIKTRAECETKPFFDKIAAIRLYLDRKTAVEVVSKANNLSIEMDGEIPIIATTVGELVSITSQAQKVLLGFDAQIQNIDSAYAEIRYDARSGLDLHLDEQVEILSHNE